MAASDVTSDARLNQHAAPATGSIEPEPEGNEATGAGTMALSDI